MTGNQQDLKQEIDHTFAMIDELGIKSRDDYLGWLKREEIIRSLLAVLRVEMPETMRLNVLRRAGVQPPISAETSETITNALGMTFVRLPAGNFIMGTLSEATDALLNHYPEAPREWFRAETPQHLVTISQPFYLSMHPVTQAQWEAVMGNNPSQFKGFSARPVENVSWNDAQQFLMRLSAADDRYTYALPTEAQWEYACRAGSTSAHSFGDNEAHLGDYAWYRDNADGTTHPVGEKRPNAWGLYDMHGNVWEWCQDWYSEYTADSMTDPGGPNAGVARVIRGGSWDSEAQYARSARRERYQANGQSQILGFRCLIFSR